MPACYPPNNVMALTGCHKYPLHRQLNYWAALQYSTSNIDAAIVADGVPWSVCQCVCRALCKTREPIEMPFGVWAIVGPRNHALDGGADPPMRRGNSQGKGSGPL